MLWEFIGETSESLHVVHGGLYNLEITTAYNRWIWIKWQSRINGRYMQVECPYSSKEAFLRNWRIYKDENR